jgi:FkbM family methyltransferase
MIDSILKWGLERNYRGFGFFTNHFKKTSEIVAPNKYGVKMSLNPYDKIDSVILRKGYFENFILDSLLTFTFNKGEVLWDIGANNGLHSLSLKQHVPEIEIYAFEPYYITFEKLVRNCLLNPCESIHLNNFGLSVNIDSKSLYTTKGNLGRTGYDPLECSEKLDFNTLTITGDILVNELKYPTPNYLKIDTEGHEFSILKGCEEILCDSIKGVVFESYSDRKRISDFLNSCGFIEISEIGKTSNYIAVRQ